MICEQKLPWNPLFHRSFEGYASILPFLNSIEKNILKEWPSVEDFNFLAKNLPFNFIKQEKNTRYNEETYLHKRIPMREHSWHDFFNNFTWLIWPTLKYAIMTRLNDEHLHKIDNHRTPRQDLLTHFDECGIIVCSHEETIFNSIEEFEWKKLFFHTKNITQNCEIIVFGHGLLEKGLCPYLGMTGKALFLKTEPQFLALPYKDKMALLDGMMAKKVLSEDFPQSPQALSPFPLLGWPGWWPGNDQEAFFENINYFRAKPKRQI